MRTPKTNIPGLVINESQGRRVAFLAADIDRQFAATNFPDHGNLLANIIRWAARDSIPLEVKGTGLIDCELYQQPGRMILHLVNVTSAGTWRAPVDELIPVGPMQVKIRTSNGARNAKALVAGGAIPTSTQSGWTSFELKSILDHEVVVLES
jgi:hypothetical protein